MVEIPQNVTGTICHVLSGDVWGGKEAQVVRLLAALQAEGMEVHAVLFNDGRVADELQRKRVPVSVFSEGDGVVSLRRNLQKFVLRLRPAWVCTHSHKETLLMASLKLQSRFRLSVMFHGLATNLSDFRGVVRLKAWVMSRLYLAAAHLLADQLVFVSRQLQSDLGFSGDPRTIVSWNTVSLAEFHEGEKHSRPEVPFDSVKAVWVGRLVPVKRVDLLLRAYAEYRRGLVSTEKNLILTIAGTGPEASTLEALASELAITDGVQFLGFVSDVPSLLMENQLLLLVSDSEGVPTVLLEAMAMGLRIIVTGVGGIPEVLECFKDYPLLQVRPGDAKHIAQAIRDVQTLPAPNRNLVYGQLDAKFSDHARAQMLANSYREHLGQSAQKPPSRTHTSKTDASPSREV